METTNKCLKEWNAVVESLGQGKQTILIRSYTTSHEKLLLFPTFSYSLKKNFLDSFKKEYHTFVNTNLLPTKENDKTEIKYYAKVEDIVEIPSKSINSIIKQFIWSEKHVKSYLKNNKPKIWLLRVYKLNEPYMAGPTPASSIKFANLKEEVSLERIEPVLSDSEFNKILNEIKLLAK